MNPDTVREMARILFLTWAAEKQRELRGDRKDSSLPLFGLPSQYLASCRAQGLLSVVDTWAPPPYVCLAQLVQHADSCNLTPQETRSSPVYHPRSCLTEGPSEERDSREAFCWITALRLSAHAMNAQPEAGKDALITSAGQQRSQILCEFLFMCVRKTRVRQNCLRCHHS